jgi:hypothetical protein
MNNDKMTILTNSEASMYRYEFTAHRKDAENAEYLELDWHGFKVDYDEIEDSFELRLA